MPSIKSIPIRKKTIYKKKLKREEKQFFCLDQKIIVFSIAKKLLLLGKWDIFLRLRNISKETSNILKNPLLRKTFVNTAFSDALPETPCCKIDSIVKCTICLAGYALQEAINRNYRQSESTFNRAALDIYEWSHNIRKCIITSKRTEPCKSPWCVPHATGIGVRENIQLTLSNTITGGIRGIKIKAPCIESTQALWSGIASAACLRVLGISHGWLKSPPPLTHLAPTATLTILSLRSCIIQTPGFWDSLKMATSCHYTLQTLVLADTRVAPKDGGSGRNIQRWWPMAADALSKYIVLTVLDVSGWVGTGISIHNLLQPWIAVPNLEKLIAKRLVPNCGNDPHCMLWDNNEFSFLHRREIEDTTKSLYMLDISGWPGDASSTTEIASHTNLHALAIPAIPAWTFDSPPFFSKTLTTLDISLCNISGLNWWYTGLSGIVLTEDCGGIEPNFLIQSSSWPWLSEINSLRTLGIRGWKISEWPKSLPQTVTSIDARYTKRYYLPSESAPNTPLEENNHFCLKNVSILWS